MDFCVLLTAAINLAKLKLFRHYYVMVSLKQNKQTNIQAKPNQTNPAAVYLCIQSIWKPFQLFAELLVGSCYNS